MRHTWLQPKNTRTCGSHLVPRFHTCLGHGRSVYEMQSGNVTEGHVCRCESVTWSFVRLVPRRSLLPCSHRKIKSGKGECVPPLSVVSQLTAESRFDWARNALRLKGYVHNIPYSFCVGTKTIPDRTSVHDKNGDLGQLLKRIEAALSRSLKWRVT